jgi:hypothetical protein
MLEAVVILSFVLAILAHIKLFLLQKTTFMLFDDVAAFLSQKKDDSFVAVPAPSAPPAQAFAANHEIIQSFYKLNADEKRAVFLTLSPNVNGYAFEKLWRACHDKDSFSSAANFQEFVLLEPDTPKITSAVKTATQDLQSKAKDHPKESQVLPQLKESQEIVKDLSPKESQDIVKDLSQQVLSQDQAQQIKPDVPPQVLLQETPKEIKKSKKKAAPKLDDV